MTILSLNGEQIGHGPALSNAVNMAFREGTVIHPKTVERLMLGWLRITDKQGMYTVRFENALTAGMVREKCANGEKFTS